MYRGTEGSGNLRYAFDLREGEPEHLAWQTGTANLINALSHTAEPHETEQCRWPDEPIRIKKRQQQKKRQRLHRCVREAPRFTMIRWGRSSGWSGYPAHASSTNVCRGVGVNRTWGELEAQSREELLIPSSLGRPRRNLFFFFLRNSIASVTRHGEQITNRKKGG